jgi:hypothetical protein
MRTRSQNSLELDETKGLHPDAGYIQEAPTVSTSSMDQACAFSANNALVAAQVVWKSSELRYQSLDALKIARNASRSPGLKCILTILVII